MLAACLSPGAISESSSSHLLPSEASKEPKPVTFPLGRSSRGDEAVGDGIASVHKDDRDHLRFSLEGNGRRGRG